MLRRLLIAAALALCSTASPALNVVFINPGRSDETFWVTASEAMHAAAQSLGVKLEVLYAERDPERALQHGRDVAARPAAQRPDYAILVNEKNTLVANAQMLGAVGVKTFAAFSGLLPQERDQWAPRKGLPLLLGSLEPRAHDAGYLTAKALIARGLAEPKRYMVDGKLHVIAIAGDRSTPVSIHRNEGLRHAITEHAAQVELERQVFADWRRDRAAELMRGLLQGPTKARLVWAGSDQMAFGAIEALEASGGKAGRELLFSGINTSNEAMQAVIDGRLTALAGGHFIAGAWALVMLYDYDAGRDFADEGLELERPMFMLFGREEARRWLARMGPGAPAGTGFRGLDFRGYSRALNPQLKRYLFDIGVLLR